MKLKNDYFYDYFNKCEKKLGDKKFKKYKLELIDVFQKNWERYLNSEEPDILISYAIDKVVNNST